MIYNTSIYIDITKDRKIVEIIDLKKKLNKSPTLIYIYIYIYLEYVIPISI